MKMSDLKKMSIKQLFDLIKQITNEPFDQSTNAKVNLVKRVLIDKMKETGRRRYETKDMGMLGIEGFIELRDKMGCYRNMCYMQVKVMKIYDDELIKILESKGDRSIIQSANDYSIKEVNTSEIKEFEKPLIDWDDYGIV